LEKLLETDLKKLVQGFWQVFLKEVLKEVLEKPLEELPKELQERRRTPCRWL